jgi:CubicO group peptidase (beta-lactamase class C family)
MLKKERKIMKPETLVPKKKTKRIAFGLLILVVIIAIVEIIHNVTKPRLSQEINNYMNVYKKSFSGTVLVAEGGKIIFEKGYGMSDYAHHKPNTLNTEYRLASLTKQFTAMAILQLQKKGHLNVNDKLSKHLPQYKNWDNITIKQLLTHTSGIPDIGLFEGPTTNLEPVPKMLSLVQNKPLDFKSGTNWEYSNSNYLILGYLVQKLSGLSYENYMKKNIFTPLHMNHTGLYTPQTAKNVSVGYNLLGGEEPSQQLYTYGDGGLYSTVQDLYKWDKALYTNKLISAQYLKQIFTPQAYTGTLGQSYGYGWFINGTGINEEISHTGTLNGYNSFIGRYPAKQISIIVLSNTSSSSSSIGSVINGLQSIANFGINPNFLLKNKTKALTPKEVQSYVGKYEYQQQNTFPSSQFMTISERNKQLFLNGVTQLQLVSKSNGHTIFKPKLSNELIMINTDFTGKVINVVTIDQGAGTFVLSPA